MSRFKIFATLSAIAIQIGTALTGNAQQLPNNGFEGGWVDCIPWTSTNNTAKQGTNPASWCISNTVGTGSMGQTTVGKNVSGFNSGSAVELTNTSQTGQVIPAYLSLGTAWSTSTVKGTAPSNKDGGTFGGYNFTCKPDALKLQYIKPKSQSDNAMVIAYLWSGTFKQADVPGNITYGLFSITATTNVTMEDRERNILDIETTKGGAITQKGTLIASINTNIENKSDDWAEFYHEFYYPDKTAVPEKINVIISASNYFTDSPAKDNSVTVDDVKLVYYSRLSNLTYSDKKIKVPGFDPNTFDYVISVDNLPASEAAIQPTVLSPSGSSKAVVTEKEGSRSAKEVTYLVTVTNSNVPSNGSTTGFEDIDGQTSHVYTLIFKKSLSIDLTKVKIGNKEFEPESGNAFANDAIIATGLPYTTDFSIETSGTDNPVIDSIVRSGNNETPTAQLTISHPDDSETTRSYSLSFLPFRAEIEEITLADGSTVSVSGETVNIGEKYSGKTVPVSVTKSSAVSGAVALNPDFGTPTDLDNPRLVISVTNSEAIPEVTKQYTLVYDSPTSSRISGVTVNGTTYPVDSDGKNIDMKAIGLMPAATEITPVYILPDGNQTYKVALNTETGAGTITITNSEGKDYDGESSHTYNLIFDSVDLSRPKKISIMNAAGDKVLTLNPAFDSKKFNYTVNGYRHDENIDDRIKFEWFDEKELTVGTDLEGDEYDSKTPKLTVTVSNPNGGTDYDGLSSHTYTFSFNQRTHDNRSVSLGSLAIDGVAIPDFDSNVFDYYINSAVIDSESRLTYSILEYDGNTTEGTEVEVTIDAIAATVTLHVSNEISNSDGEDERTYTLHFLPYYSRMEAIQTDGEKIELLEETGETIRVTVPGQMPNNVADIEKTFIFPANTAGVIQHEITLNPETATATVKVSNSKPDIDGISSRTYTLRYDAPFFSRLESLVIGGVAVPGFTRNTFAYTIDTQMPSNPTITPTVIKGGNTAGKVEIKEKSADAEKALVTVVVTNTQPDIDGESTHTYTVQYALPYFSRLESVTIGGVEIADLPQDGKTPALFDGQLPASDEEAQQMFDYSFKVGSGNPVATVVLDRTNAVARITVTNGGQKDIDGKTSHLYIIRFSLPYFSTASSIMVGNEEIADFSPEVLEYTVDGQMPEADKIIVNLSQGSGTSNCKVTTDKETATATITVTNPGDENGKYASTTVYTLHFDLPYFSRLASLKVRGNDVADFDSDIFEYTLPGIVPAASEITATAKKCSGKANVKVSRDVANGIVTITVTNSEGSDIDGSKTHTYILNFDKPVNSRLSAITISGTPLADFDTDNFFYKLSDIEMPAEGEIQAISSNPNAKIEIVYNTDKNQVIITVSADSADEDGMNSHTYTLSFKKAAAPAPSTGKTIEYTGTLNIYMMGDDITGGGQEAKVEIKENNDGTCTFSLPDFSLDLGDGPASLGDIVVENVTMTPDGNGGYVYSGEVKGLELAEGTIIADVTLNGTTDAQGNAKMKILVLWEGIEIDVEFNGVKTAETGNTTPTPAPDDEWNEFDGTLSIEMGGSYIAENQKATVYITEAVDGKCTFKLPDFSINLEGTELPLGDIVVEDVNVEEESGITKYSGFVPEMEFLEGEIIADINLTGTVDAAGNARMTIQVLWKASEDESIPINVEFNGKRNETAWLTIPGILTVALDGYDITEGGQQAEIKIAQTGDDGLYTFLLPDFSIALDAASDPAELGDIQVDDIIMTPGEGYDRYTGKVDGMILAGGEIVANVKVDGTITTSSDVRINVDVTWFMDNEKRVPILVKFSNTEEIPAAAEKVIYSGILTTETDNSVKNHDVRIHITPAYGNRADCKIEGIDFAGSRAAAIGNSVTVPSVSINSLPNGFKAYDGAVSAVTVQPGMTLDINLHGYSDLANKFNLLMDIDWIEEGIRISGTFTGNIDVTEIAPVYSPDNNGGNVEYYNLNGVKVNGNNLAPGIYIRKCGNKSEKILVK